MIGNLLEPVIGGAIQLPARGRHSMRCVVAIRLLLLGPARLLRRFRFETASRRGLSSSASGADITHSGLRPQFLGLRTGPA